MTLRSFLPLAILLPLLTTAQGLVSHSPMNRTVLLEEYTAVNCGNCPAAHMMAGNIFNGHPNDVVGVEVHGGALANPSGSQPDFRTAEGAALWSQFNVTFQPQGMVNRQGLQSAAQWTAAVNTALAQPSPVNIGLATTFDQGSRLLSVDVELYYTADGTGGNDRIHVLLTEDHIIGYQQDYVNGPQQNYDHQHVLRTYITPLAGDEVIMNTVGSSVMRSYMITVPEAWNIDQCAAVAFIGEQSVGSTPGVVYQVKSVAASGGATMGIADVANQVPGNAYPVPAVDLVTIPLDGSMVGMILIHDASGRMVATERVSLGQRSVTLNVSRLPNGVYRYGFAEGPARPLVVVH